MSKENESSTTSAGSAATGAGPSHPTKKEVGKLRKSVEAKLAELTKKDKRPDGEYSPGWVRSKEGGMMSVNEEELAKQKGVVSDLLRKIGSNIIQGKSIVNISLPVRVFEPRSFLQRIPDSWCYGPIHLTKAALSTDPVERLKHVVCFAISGLYRSCTNYKPFNPILGETFQATFSDGSEVLLEQVSHHPPISDFQLIGPHNLYYLHGFHEFAASMRANSVLGQQIGPNEVEFFDGGKVSYNMPNAVMKGTVMGERNFCWGGTMTFTDQINRLQCEVTFNPDSKSAFSRLFSSQKSPTDTIRGDIVQWEGPSAEEGETVVVSHLEGSWMDEVKFDDEVYWKQFQFAPFETIPIDDPLPSDCRFREDLKFLLEDDEPSAQEWKETLENRQRTDRQLREQHAKVQKKMEKAAKKAEKERMKQEKKEMKKSKKQSQSRDSISSES